MAPNLVHFPEMALTLIRRVGARLPYNNFLFRTEVHWTKAEIREYLEKVYNVRVARIATTISLGACARAPWAEEGRKLRGGGRKRRQRARGRGSHPAGEGEETALERVRGAQPAREQHRGWLIRRDCEPSSLTQQPPYPVMLRPPYTPLPPPITGKIRRVTGQRNIYKLKDFKKVYVRIEDERTKVPAPAAERSELR